MQITIKADQPQAILIGHEGEYAVESVLFDVSVWEAEYGAGTLTLIYERPGGDPQRYPVVLSDNAWTIGTADTAYEGRGAAQLTYELANGRKKSCIFDVYVAKSFESTPAPDPYETWMDALQAMAALTQANAQRAEASAEAAETSETNAAASEAAAKASETAAATSEANAAGSATSAAESAGSASSSATAAASSETNAAGSASAAAASETNAATSATQAASSATSAGSSATAAAGSATSAGNSATAASGSASAAAGSAASASESATSAAGSASSASGSATAASASANAAYSSALDSEAWAVGQKAGVDVPATDARYHNNSKFYAQQAAESATSAAGSATAASGSATSAGNSATNAAASAQAAQDVLDSIPEDYSELSADVSSLKDDLENKDDWLVGTANQLLSDSYTEDKVPYVFRKTGGDLSVGDREADTIVGGSIVWNQLASFNLSDWDSYGRISVNVVNEAMEITTTADTSFKYMDKLLTQNHKYLFTAEITAPIVENDETYNFIYGIYKGLSTSNVQERTIVQHNTSVVVKRIYNCTVEKPVFKLTHTTGTPAGITATVDKPQLFDLTQMFGSTIADYIYSLERATAGEGVAWFKQYFPEDYYDYDPGTLKFITGLVSHDMIGTDQNDRHSYPLDSSLTLRGIPKLDANNRMYFDGDVYASDGTVTRKYGIVNIGSLAWRKNGNIFFSHDLEASIKKPSSTITLNINVICNKYRLVKWSNVGTAGDWDFAVNTTGEIAFQNSTYASVNDFILGENETYLVFELATTITENAEPYAPLQICNEYGTEEYVYDSEAFPIPVGHDTKYYVNLRKKIDGLPWDLSMIAPIETGTTASKPYTAGQFFLLNSQFCKAKTNIASGATFTLNTNYEVTTVANELYTALNA